jgi:hypothetical protein
MSNDLVFVQKLSIIEYITANCAVKLFVAATPISGPQFMET